MKTVAIKGDLSNDYRWHFEEFDQDFPVKK